MGIGRARLACPVQGEFRTSSSFPLILIQWSRSPPEEEKASFTIQNKQRSAFTGVSENSNKCCKSYVAFPTVLITMQIFFNCSDGLSRVCDNTATG